MKIIASLLLLLINISIVTSVAAEANSLGQSSHDRRLQVDRYTGYKTNAALEEVNPLLVLTQINFPSAVKTVQEAIDHALQRSGYRVDWQQSSEAYNIFSRLDIPAVHKKLNLMTLKDAIATLTGEAWQLIVDSVNRKLIIQLHADMPWQVADGFDDSGTHRLYPEESISPAPQAQANRYPFDNPTSLQTELNHYRPDNSVSAQTELNHHPSDNFVFAPLEQKHFQHEYPVLPGEQLLSDTNMAYDDVSENTVIHDGSAADVVYSGEAKTETLISDNADLYDETSDRSRNQYGEENIRPYHLIKTSYVDNANLPDNIPNIHRVQYTPQHSESPYAGLSRQDKQIPTEIDDIAPDLWSVQPVIKAKEGVGSLDEAVIVHYSSISVKNLIEVLIPEGWVVHYEVPDAILKQKLVSHAESSRRNALSSLFKELNLRALFYPGQAVVVVAEKEPKSYDYGHFAKSKAIDNQNVDAVIDALPNPPDAYESQPQVDTILRNAKTIKNLMNEMEPNPK